MYSPFNFLKLLFVLFTIVQINDAPQFSATGGIAPNSIRDV